MWVVGKDECIGRLEDAMAGKNSVKAAEVKEEKAPPKEKEQKKKGGGGDKPAAVAGTSRSLQSWTSGWAC